MTILDLLAATEGRLEAVKALAAMLFFFSTLMVVSYLAMHDKLTPGTTGTILMGMLAVMAALLRLAIDWSKLSVTDLTVARFTPPSPATANLTPSAYGFALKHTHVKHEYHANGDFHGEWTYSVTNATHIRLRDLLPDKSGWFGKDLAYQATARAEGQGAAFMKIELPQPHARSTTVQYVNGSPLDVTYLTWQPVAATGVGPGESLEYSVVIDTVGTESAAFSEFGSYAGIATDLYAEELSCEVICPPGHRFLNKGFILRDRTGATVKQEKLEQPVFSEDGSTIRWRVEKPIPSVLYLLRIVIEKRA